jgi:hypothetical protein
MRKHIAIILLLSCQITYSQGRAPWESPLKMAWSGDGITFGTPTIFQDSAGVPSVIRWKGDTLACVFQWFRQPMNSITWDRVAVKFSYNAGLTWTQPTPIKVNGLPGNYQRPFDPTLAVINNTFLRIYFSSSNGMPVGGLTSIVDTYSAISSDGVTYTFEPDARVDDSVRPVIDPAIIYFKGMWHYVAPAGAPQDGAFHFTSNDGLNFTQQAKYTSDNIHNWTGNFMLNNSNEMRFYGSGQMIWYNSSSDGFVWQGFINTSLKGGDPSVTKTANSDYLAIYVGEPYNVGIHKDAISEGQKYVYPNPFTSTINVIPDTNVEFYVLINSLGSAIWTGKQIEKQDFSGLITGLYFLKVNYRTSCQIIKLLKL